MEKELLEKALTEWCNKWTIEFLRDNVMSHIEEFKNNQLAVHFLEKWYIAHVRNEKIRLNWINMSLKDNKSADYEVYIDKDEYAFSNVIYETFMFYNKGETI